MNAVVSNAFQERNRLSQRGSLAQNLKILSAADQPSMSTHKGTETFLILQIA
jgi:hypothetical protein